ncbi:hypothetical protein GCM10010327_17910 [Streptomyces nitrosporeus]|nr:hypothetical protein GCM10010327_17910 [Streptomyces nitrosporeus]
MKWPCAVSTGEAEESQGPPVVAGRSPEGGCDAFPAVLPVETDGRIAETGRRVEELSGADLGVVLAEGPVTLTTAMRWAPPRA